MNKGLSIFQISWVSRAITQQWLRLSILTVFLALRHTPELSLVDSGDQPRVVLFRIFEKSLISFERTSTRLWGISLRERGQRQASIYRQTDSPRSTRQQNRW